MTEFHDYSPGLLELPSRTINSHASVLQVVLALAQRGRDLLFTTMISDEAFK